MDSNLKHVPAFILSAEYLLGGFVRVSPWPFPGVHDRVCRKNAKITPVLYPIVPFKNVKSHNRWVGAWMMATGILWANPSTRRSPITLGLSLFWTAAGAYSQWRTGMPFWLPVVNFILSLVVWQVESQP